MNERLWMICLAALVGCSTACGPDARKVAKPSSALAPPKLSFEPSPERAERAPISLTASDGSGLTLVSMRVRSVIEDPLAFTELQLTFQNPEPRRREGRFEITLPPQAAISRFAMSVPGGFQEGEVVERRRAQQVYEDFLHRRQDPALLEKDAGNEFAARVFPIEANATKEIVVSYSEELARRDAPYVVRLQGLPKLEKFEVDVRVGSSSDTGRESSQRARQASAHLTLSEREYVPVADLEVKLPRQKAVALRNGNLVVARVAPVLELPDEPIAGLTVLFDTSASRALGFAAQIERVATLIAELRKRAKADFDLELRAFDQTSETLYRGPAGEFGLREQGKLLSRDALGASDLEQALAALAREPAGHARVLLVSDGVVTAGVDDTTSLREAVTRLAAHGVRRFDVLGEGGIQDRENLTALTRAGLSSAGVVLDSRLPVTALADKLLRGTRERIGVHVTGASFVYPPALEGVQAGDEWLIYAELPADSPLQIELEGAGAEAFETMQAPKPLLERACARARIEALRAELQALRPQADVERARLEQMIVKLSVEQRVLSDQTALLVLETPEDYRRFGIEQQALASILRVGDEGLELFDRQAPVLPRARPVEQLARDEEQDGLAAPPQRTGPDERVRLERRASSGGPPSTRGDDRAKGADKAGGASRGFAPAPSGVAASAPARAAGRGVDLAAEEPTIGGLAAPAPPPFAARERKSESSQPTAAFDRGRSAPEGESAAGLPAPAKRSAAPVDSWLAGDAKVANSTEASGSLGASASQGRAEADGPGSGAPRTAAGIEADRPGSEAQRTAAHGAIAADRSGSGAPLPERSQIAAPELVPNAAVRPASVSGLDQAQAAASLRSLAARARQCAAGGRLGPAAERVTLSLAISNLGSVADASLVQGSLSDRAIQSCLLSAARALRFPKPEGASAHVSAHVELSMREAAPRPAAIATKPVVARRAARVPSPAIEDAYEGPLANVLSALQREDLAAALEFATRAHAQDPGDVPALIALGEVLEAQGQWARAARAYGSLIDLFPSRADLRRMAGARLERLPSFGLPLAVDSYRRAVEQRPDQPSGERALAYALYKQGERAAAFAAIESALSRGLRAERFQGVDRILREDLQLLAAAWVRAEPAALPRVRAALEARGLELDHSPSTRFVLSWETDANDVDFHLYDGRGGHAYYMAPKLASGGVLYADITTGYGPECFAIPGRARAYPYVLQAHYYARGPMGYGMGKLQVLEHDGEGGLRVQDHPFVIMKDKAFVELARVNSPS